MGVLKGMENPTWRCGGLGGEGRSERTGHVSGRSLAFSGLSEHFWLGNRSCTMKVL